MPSLPESGVPSIIEIKQERVILTQGDGFQNQLAENEQGLLRNPRREAAFLMHQELRAGHLQTRIR